MKRTEGLGFVVKKHCIHFFRCFYVEAAVIFIIISLAGKIKLSEQAKVGSCWFM